MSQNLQTRDSAAVTHSSMSTDVSSAMISSRRHPSAREGILFKEGECSSPPLAQMKFQIWYHKVVQFVHGRIPTFSPIEVLCSVVCDKGRARTGLIQVSLGDVGKEMDQGRNKVYFFITDPVFLPQILIPDHKNVENFNP